MPQKPLGKRKYHFTCPPDLLARFDAIAAALGTTRSDLLVGLIRERAAVETINAPPHAPRPAAPPSPSGRSRPTASGAVDRRPAPARARNSK